MEPEQGNILAERFHETQKQLRGLLLKLWGTGFLLILIGFGIAWIFAKPAPPSRIVIAAGPSDGAYYACAQRYGEYLAQHHITLEIRETAGSVENYDLLMNDPSVNLAIVQGGTRPDDLDDECGLETIGSLYLEPVWLFRRRGVDWTDLRNLRGLRVGIGNVGSGTLAISRLMLKANGIPVDDRNQFRKIGGRDAAEELIEGELDAMFIVMAPQSTLIYELLHEPELELVAFERAPAYGHRYSFLTDVNLDRGVVDLEHDLPARTIEMVAPAANLVATTEFHDSLVPILLKSASIVHGRGDAITEPGDFPNADHREFPLNESAGLYFDHGLPFLQKYLPFWVASAIDRGKILLLPLLTLLIPLFKVAPPLYRWRIRSRIYRWYEILREMESDLRSPLEPSIIKRHLLELKEIEDEFDDLDSVPLAYMEEFYNLRLHVEFVQRRLLKAQEILDGEPDDGVTAGDQAKPASTSGNSADTEGSDSGESGIVSEGGSDEPNSSTT